MQKIEITANPNQNAAAYVLALELYWRILWQQRQIDYLAESLSYVATSAHLEVGTEPLPPIAKMESQAEMLAELRSFGAQHFPDFQFTATIVKPAPPATAKPSPQRRK